MGMMRRKTARRVLKPADVRRAELLQAAAELFVEHGPDNVSIARITERAGVAKGTFYVHFADRDELLQALRTQVALGAADRLAKLPHPATARDWPPFVDEVVETALTFLEQNWSIHEVLASRPHAHVGGTGELAAIDELTEAIRGILDEGAAVGAIDCEDSSTAARLVFEVVHAAGHLAHQDGSDRTRVATTTAQLLRRGLLRTG